MAYWQVISLVAEDCCCYRNQDVTKLVGYYYIRNGNKREGVLGYSTTNFNGPFLILIVLRA